MKGQTRVWSFFVLLIHNDEARDCAFSIIVLQTIFKENIIVGKF